MRESFSGQLADDNGGRGPAFELDATVDALTKHPPAPHLDMWLTSVPVHYGGGTPIAEPGLGSLRLSLLERGST